MDRMRQVAPRLRQPLGATLLQLSELRQKVAPPIYTWHLGVTSRKRLGYDAIRRRLRQGCANPLAVFPRRYRYGGVGDPNTTASVGARSLGRCDP